MIIGKGKRAIEEHFDRNFELEAELEAEGQDRGTARPSAASPTLANIHFVWQKELNGLGDAISCARDHVGNEPFAVLLGDTLMESAEAGDAAARCSVFERYQESVVALEEVEPRQGQPLRRHRRATPVEDGLYLIEDFVEKPSLSEAPSNLAIAGRYVLTPDIFDYIAATAPRQERRDPAHRRHAAAGARPAPCTGCASTACATTSATSSTSSGPIIIYGLKRKDLAPDLIAFIRQLAAEHAPRKKKT